MKWYKDDQPIKPDKRIVIAKEGRKRKVVIKDAKVTDAGHFKCVSNADETACELTVKCKSILLSSSKWIHYFQGWSLSEAIFAELDIK